MSKEKETSTIARINEVSILMIQDGEKLIPIKPICEALGIDEDAQRRKLLKDEILKSTTVLSTVVAADGKDRPMTCIPYMFVFGWLFSINPKNVKEEAKETVKKYRLECYKALYNHFTEAHNFLNQKNDAIEKELEYYDDVSADFKDARTRMNNAKTRLKAVRKTDIETWRANNMQLSLDFDYIYKV